MKTISDFWIPSAQVHNRPMKNNFRPLEPIGLGLRPCETEADGNHIIVVSIGDGSQAKKTGQIAIGDAIYSIGGVNVVGKVVHNYAKTCKQCSSVSRSIRKQCSSVSQLILMYGNPPNQQLFSTTWISTADERASITRSSACTARFGGACHPCPTLRAGAKGPDNRGPCTENDTCSCAGSR